jgi:hypothetical protein
MPGAASQRQGSAADTPVQAGASTAQQASGQDPSLGDAGESGAAGTGVGTTPQRATEPPLGEATDLEVTLEEVLLASRKEDQDPERRSRPSRRAEDVLPTAASASSASAAASSPELERPALKVPYPLRARALVREFFAPRPDETQDTTGTDEESP